MNTKVDTNNSDGVTKDKEEKYRCLVVMPFSKDWSNDVFNSIKEIEKQLNLEIFRVDNTKRKHLKLSQDVEEQIRDAEIIIADVTKQNPNVQIEIGFALANEKPILICTQNQKDICSHLNDYLFIKYNKEKLESLKEQLLPRICEVIERYKLEKEKRELEQKLQKTYEVTCYSEREVANFSKIFDSAHHRIDILTTNLNWLFSKGKNQKKSYWEIIKDAVKNNDSLQLRILTLDPQSENAASRGRQLGFERENFRFQLKEAYIKVRDFAKDFTTNRVEVRLYDELPTQITFRVDEKVFTCIVGQPMQSRKYPVLEFNILNLGVKEAFLSHFLEIWKGVIK